MSIKPIREFGQQLTNIEVVKLIKGELNINDIPSYKETKEKNFPDFDGVPNILSYQTVIPEGLTFGGIWVKVAWYVVFNEKGEQIYG